MNPNVVCSSTIKVKLELANNIARIFIDTYTQVCRFNDVDVSQKVISQVEYSENEKKLSFNHAGLSERNFK